MPLLYTKLTPQIFCGNSLQGCWSIRWQSIFAVFMLWLSIVFLEILLFEFIFESTIVMNYLSLVNLQVLSRLAPFERGIYEDYVANFWCTTSVLVKWKRIFTIQSLKLLSLGATVSTCLPSMVQQIWAPSNQGFLYGLLNSAFSFYMFSFQGKSSFFFFFP